MAPQCESQSREQNVSVSFRLCMLRRFRSVSSSINRSTKGTNTFHGGKNKEIKMKGGGGWKWALCLFSVSLQRTQHNVSPSWVETHYAAPPLPLKPGHHLSPHPVWNFESIQSDKTSKRQWTDTLRLEVNDEKITHATNVNLEVSCFLPLITQLLTVHYCTTTLTVQLPLFF